MYPKYYMECIYTKKKSLFIWNSSLMDVLYFILNSASISTPLSLLNLSQSWAQTVSLHGGLVYLVVKLGYWTKGYLRSLFSKTLTCRKFHCTSGTIWKIRWGLILKAIKSYTNIGNGDDRATYYIKLCLTIKLFKAFLYIYHLLNIPTKYCHKRSQCKWYLWIYSTYIVYRYL